MSAAERIEIIEEGARVMTICNACRYCEGHCAVFPAMERRLVFDEATIDYLSNLCHQCGACYHHCQYADPHEFNVNVPGVLSVVRQSSYEKFTRPGFMSFAFQHGLAFSLGTLVVSLLLFVGGLLWLKGPAALIQTYPGGFYEFIPHELMASTFGVAGVIVMVGWWLSIVACWRAMNLPSPFVIPFRAYLNALVSGLTLKNLDGGHGEGCYETGDAPSLSKRRFHHLVMYGFLLCFTATVSGTIYHYVFGWPAPYGWLSVPKMFGLTGGIMLAVGCVGLFSLRMRVHEAIRVEDNGLGAGLLLLLFLTSVTGLALPLLRDSNWLALMLCLHLAVVLALFINFSWGKFMHGFYRFVALLADATESLADKSRSEDKLGLS